MKGNASCHLPSDSYRDHYAKTFGKSMEKAEEITDADEVSTGIAACAICGEPVPPEESICSNCKLMQPQDFEWGETE